MLVVLSFPLLASADDYFDPPGTAGGIYSDCKTKSGFVPLECFEQSGKLRGAYSEEDLGKFMQKLFVGAISLGAILAVLRLAWAGFVYMGTDLWGKKEHAKEVIRDTLLGLFLLIAIALILNQINPQLLQLKVNAGGGSSTDSGIQPAPSDFFAPNAGYRGPTISVNPGGSSGSPIPQCTIVVDGQIIPVACP